MAAVRSKVVILFFLLPFGVCVFVCVCSLFCDEVLSVIFSFAIILLRKRELVALRQLCYGCHVGVCVP